MNRTSLIVTPFSIAAAVSANATEAQALAKAREPAKSWLALTDAGHGATSWQAAAARGPLGALRERSLKSATFARTLPGAPDGEYVVIRFASRFENKAFAIETVTPMREKDGSWKVSGYCIR